MIQSAIEQLAGWARAIRNGEEVDSSMIEDTLAEACRAVPTSDRADVRRLAAAVEDLEVLIRDRYEEVGEELRRLGQGRQALKGYNHLRGHLEGQRLYRRV